jgi:hypothetical protein
VSEYELTWARDSKNFQHFLLVSDSLLMLYGSTLREAAI